MRKIVIAIACLLLLGTNAAHSEGQVKVENGTLGQSKIMIAAPGKWNGRVLILVHGLRGESSPLTAEFDVNEVLEKQLLSDGWIIASTSFRRNGYIIDEAIQDVDELRDYVIKKYGKPKQIFLQGGSMGGRIVMHIAETHAGKYDGAVAIDAVLVLDSASYTFDPKMPVLFLTNQSETQDAKAYIAKAAKPAIRPAFWLVKRDGHCIVTGDELLSATRGLVTYRNTGKIEFDKDATIASRPPASVVRIRDGKAIARVTKIDSAYANVLTNLVASDMERLGIRKGDKFQVSFGDKRFSVLYATTYNDVAKGEWVAFVVASGHLKIARNYESSARTLGCQEGSEISVGPVSPAGATSKEILK